MTTQYWENDQQMVTCLDHAGAYLQAAIAEHPRAKTHNTPLGEWIRLSADEISEIHQMREEFNLPTSDSICEVCNSRVAS
jgi:hypothetical protein